MNSTRTAVSMHCVLPFALVANAAGVHLNDIDPQYHQYQHPYRDNDSRELVNKVHAEQWTNTKRQNTTSTSGIDFFEINSGTSIMDLTTSIGGLNPDVMIHIPAGVLLQIIKFNSRVEGDEPEIDHRPNTVPNRERLLHEVTSELKANSDFEVVISRLIALADRSDENYDEDFWPAESSAITTAIGITQSAGLRLGKQFPRALVAPNGMGGLSVEWRKPDKAVKLMISPMKSQIFHLFGDEGDFDEATDAALAKWLRKFID